MGNINRLKAWAESYGYYLRTHPNAKLEGVHNCYIKLKDQAEDKCVKAFLYNSEFDAVLAACQWLYRNYKKVTLDPLTMIIEEAKVPAYLVFYSYHSGEHFNFTADSFKEVIDSLNEECSLIAEHDGYSKDEMLSGIKIAEVDFENNKSVWHEYPNSTWVTITKVAS